MREVIKMMTERIFKSMMNKLSAGEYDASDVYNIYMEVCPKSYKDISKYENNMRCMQFMCMFEEKKYGFEYMFNQKIRYIGTNDLHTLVVNN